MTKIQEKLIKNDIIPLSIIVFLSLFYFIGLGYNHLFDWDEINFAECAREMIKSGNFLQVQINFEPFYEKPPLFIWMQVLSMSIFGINEFASRFPNAIFGVITLISLFYIGKKYKDRLFGLIWSLLYFGSLLPHIYFKSGIIDPVFNFFIFCSIYFMIRTINDEKTHFAILSGIFSGLSVLTKGPVGFLILFLTILVYLIISKFRDFPKIKYIITFFLCFAITISFWFGIESIVNGTEFIKQFIIYQIELFTKPVAGHEQAFYYHFVVVFFGCFPFSIFALNSFTFRKKETNMNFLKWMQILFWVVIILFTIVKTKIIHYSSMTYMPLAFIGSYTLYKFIINKSIKKWILYLYTFVGFIISSLFVALPVVAYNKEKIIPYINDKFAVDNLMQNVVWSGYEYIIGLFMFGFIVISVLMIRKNKVITALLTQSVGIAITLLMFLFMVVPKIEQYSQGAAINFFKEVKSKDVYFKNVGYKSYAPYFYGEIKADNNPLSKDYDWLYSGPIDKPVYFITKTTYHDLSNDNVRLYKTIGGFKIYLRTP
ncbi:MAG: phospholipid carrier-dependent glycosyltransferase [Marinilabiliales bacterium]